MMKKRTAKRATFVAAAAAFAGAILATPASAAQVDAYYHGTHAAADNSPGSGAAGWVWVYGSTEAHATQGSVQYQLWDGSTGELTVDRGKSASRNTGSDVKAFRACYSIYVDGYDFPSCGSWVYFG